MNPFRQSDHGECVAASLGREGGAIDRIDGDVAFRGRAIADALAVVEHRGFVFFAFADNDGAIHRNGAESKSHGIDGSAVCAFLVATAHPAARSEGGGFGHANEIEGNVAVKRDVGHDTRRYCLGPSRPDRLTGTAIPSSRGGAC